MPYVEHRASDCVEAEPGSNGKRAGLRLRLMQGVGDDVSIEHRRVAARQRLERNSSRSLSDAGLAELAIAQVHDAVQRAGELTDDQAAEAISEDARQMRAERRAGQHVH
jgi:hypothetical protein